MTEVPKEAVAAAEAYESLHVPSLFSEWAPKVLDAANVREGDRVLDVACGTGILAREAARRVGESGSVAGVDPDLGMLSVARRLEPSVDWQQGTADALPFPDGAFDAVVSQFGLMFFPDREAALRDMMRVLAPGGRLAVAVWDALERSEAYPTEVEILDRIGGKPAGDALRAPFVLGDKKKLRALFESAGADSVEVTTHHGTARFPSVRAMVEADLRGWLPIMGVHLDEDRIERILEEAETALSRFVAEDGRTDFDAPAHIVTGKRE